MRGRFHEEKCEEGIAQNKEVELRETYNKRFMERIMKEILY